jgi:hypothetical protein
MDLIVDPILPVHKNTTESTHGLHPVSPGGHYTDINHARSDSVSSAEEADRTYERVDPPIKAHIARHSNGSTPQ